VLLAFFSVPLGAQLEEAARVPWPGFEVLKGHWRALEGGNVIDVKNISPTGIMEVYFFNPDSVRVNKAQAARDGTETKVLIELRNPGSFCCTYDMTYDPSSGQLKGVYWLKANFRSTDVVFIRDK
jgi:hypothetical protein